MNCNEAGSLFSLCIDNGLSFEEQSELDLHLKRCSGCALELERVRRTVEMVHGLPEVQAAPAFVQEVLKAAREAAKAPQKEHKRTLWERLRANVPALDWDPAPRLALVGTTLLVLGIVVGVGEKSVYVAVGRKPADLPELTNTVVVPD